MRPTSRKEREYLTRRKDILLAGERCFAANGFDRTTMGEIARQAEFAVGTLYQFFSSKEELYRAIIREKMEELGRLIRSEASRAARPCEKIDRVVDAFGRHFEENDRFFRIYLDGARQYSWDLKAGGDPQMKHMYRVHLNFLRGIFARGIEEGQFVATEPRALALGFQEMLNAFVAEWLTGPKKRTLRDQLGDFKRIFFQGAIRGDTGEKSKDGSYQETL